MVKVGGYILGEFGNLIAGDPRSGCVSYLFIITDVSHASVALIGECNFSEFSSNRVLHWEIFMTIWPALEYLSQCEPSQSAQC